MFPIAVQYRANNNKNDVVYKTHLVKEDTEIDGDDYIFYFTQQAEIAIVSSVISSGIFVRIFIYLIRIHAIMLFFQMYAE